MASTIDQHPRKNNLPIAPFYHRISPHSPTHPYHRAQQISSFFPDELYQGYITGLPGGKWFTLQLPFRDMTLTRLGRLSYVQRDLDGSFTLESIGGFVAGLGVDWFWTCFWAVSS